MRKILPVLCLAAGLVFPAGAHASARSCGDVGGTYRIKATNVGCADARGFARVWSRSCYGQGQGTIQLCSINLPSRPRTVPTCHGRPDGMGMFRENRSRGRCRIRFEADM